MNLETAPMAVYRIDESIGIVECEYTRSGNSALGHSYFDPNFNDPKEIDEAKRKAKLRAKRKV